MGLWKTIKSPAEPGQELVFAEAIFLQDRMTSYSANFQYRNPELFNKLTEVLNESSNE